MVERDPSLTDRKFRELDIAELMLSDRTTGTHLEDFRDRLDRAHAAVERCDMAGSIRHLNEAHEAYRHLRANLAYGEDKLSDREKYLIADEMADSEAMMKSFAKMGNACDCSRRASSRKR